jgi:hypothetical protein
MIDALEDTAHIKPFNRSAVINERLTKPTPIATDTIQISDAEKNAMHENKATNIDTNIRAKCGDLEAQRLIELKAAKRKLLGLE